MTTAPVRPSAPHLAAGPDELVRRFVREGDHVHAAATMSRPNALLNAVCRAFAGSRSLTVSTTAVHSSAHALALSGAVRKVITGFVGDTFPRRAPTASTANSPTGSRSRSRCGRCSATPSG